MAVLWKYGKTIQTNRQCCACKSRNRQRNHRLRATNTKRYDELKALDKDISSALYKLAFKTYEGF